MYIQNKMLILKRSIHDNMHTKGFCVGGICFTAGMNAFLMDSIQKIILYITIIYKLRT